MCGIAGSIGEQGLDLESLSRSLNSIHHRGPDERGTFLSPGVALGICRLAIIDVSTGQQPVSDASGALRMVFNGEIYNFQELRKVLIAKGHQFTSLSDSEVVLHMYQEYGHSFVKQLKGMFALAIWDSRDNSLILARDHMGKKPLFYAQNSEGTLLFASEVKALIAGGLKVSLRKEVIAEVMQFGYVNAPLTSYAEISQIPPACLGVWKDGAFTISQFWSPDFETRIEINYEDALERTKDLILQAVERRLVSERPLGSFLSGGYDSTVVTAYMTQLMKEKVKTFSIGFSDPRFDESAYARRVARHLGTEHVEERLSPDPALLLQQLASTLDQPFADSSIIPTFMLAQFASKEVVVALGGDGGDEVFGGYDRYRAAPFMRRLNPLLVATSPIAKKLVQINAFHSRKLNRILSQVNGSASLAQRYCSIMSLGKSDQLRELLVSEYQNLSTEAGFVSDFSRQGANGDLAKMARSDFERYLPGDLLVKADRATMANSLELRSPLLDVDLVEWALRLPDAYKIKGRQTKFILKDIARSLVPAELIDRPKMGFAIPRADWLRTGLRTMTYDLLLDSTAKGRGWFQPIVVERLINDHQAGVDRDELIWPMLMLELWARTWLDH